MQQRLDRFLSPSAILATLKTTKFPGLRWLFHRPSTLLGRLPRLRRSQKREGDTADDFVVIISLQYERWKAYPNGDDMQLKTVKNDTKALLDYLGHRHNKADGRRWYFLLDYDFVYKDGSGKSQKILPTDEPTKDNILRILREARSNGGSGLIHYSGHCHYEATVASELKRQDGYILYKETEGEQEDPKVAYLIPSDGEMISSKEFYISLQNMSKNARASTITVVLDTCKAEAFIGDFDHLSVICDHELEELDPDEQILSPPVLDQLVVATAARADEIAWTVNDFGVLTYFLLKCLKEDPEASATQVAKYLSAKCMERPDKEKRQRPRIWSRYPLVGPFRLLPENST